MRSKNDEKFIDNRLFFSLSYNLPIIFIIINNGGIYAGVDKESFDEMARQDAELK